MKLKTLLFILLNLIIFSASTIYCNTASDDQRIGGSVAKINKIELESININSANDKITADIIISNNDSEGFKLEFESKNYGSFVSNSAEVPYTVHVIRGSDKGIQGAHCNALGSTFQLNGKKYLDFQDAVSATVDAEYSVQILFDSNFDETNAPNESFVDTLTIDLKNNSGSTETLVLPIEVYASSN